VIIAIAILFWSITAFSEIYSGVIGERLERYGQNEATEYWEEVTHRNFPLGQDISLLTWRGCPSGLE
jgi:hypothetical protein